jgi:hypothetical protein
VDGLLVCNGSVRGIYAVNKAYPLAVAERLLVPTAG